LYKEQCDWNIYEKIFFVTTTTTTTTTKQQQQQPYWALHTYFGKK
jgi:hypothetical protein